MRAAGRDGIEDAGPAAAAQPLAIEALPSGLSPIPPAPSEPWTELRTELDRWAARGRRPSFWWRDDDAVAPGEALDRLLALAARHGRQVVLAVIPALAEAALAKRLAGTATVVIQHGWNHHSYAAAGQKKAELGDDRPEAAILADLIAGRTRLSSVFGDRFRPVLAPPWNRIGPRARQLLGKAGLTVLSGFGPREAVPGLHLVNTHADPIDWRGSRGFAGVGRTLAPVLRHLADRRTGAADPDEPTGVLTHHLVHDWEGWAFLDALFAALGAHPAVDWPDADTLFGARP